MSDAMVAYVRTRSKSTGVAKFLLVLLASHHNHLTGLCNPSIEILAWELTKSEPYVRKLLLQLEALGELQVIRGRGRTHVNHYKFTLPDEERPRPQKKGHSEVRFSPPEKGTLRVQFSAREKGTPEPEKGTMDSEKGHSYVSPKVIKEKKEEPDALASDTNHPHRMNPFWCGACGYLIQACIHRIVEV